MLAVATTQSELWLLAARRHRAVLTHPEALMVLSVCKLRVDDTRGAAWDSSHRAMHAISLVLQCSAEGIGRVHRWPSIGETLHRAFGAVVAESPEISLLELTFEWAVVSEDRGAYRGHFVRDLRESDPDELDREMASYLRHLGVDQTQKGALEQAQRALVACAPSATRAVVAKHFFGHRS